MSAPVAAAAKQAPARQEAGRSAAHAAPVPQPVFAPPVLIQRKCACGGGCPTCDEEKKKPVLQTKLRVNTPGDAFEQEADRVADQVVAMAPSFSPAVSAATASTAPAFSPATPSLGRAPPSAIQRKCACGGSCSECEEKEELAQRKAAPNSGETAAAAVDVHPQSLGSGDPLDRSTRSFMESRFNSDFSNVRVHNGLRAASAAQSVNALAYTVGSDIVFGQGQYSPGTTGGNRLLAHELTHVLQQSAGVRLLQRQAEPGDGDDVLDAPEFGNIENDPDCPTGGVQLGKVAPDPPCDEDLTPEDDEDGVFFEFCRGSDVFRDKTSPGRVRSFVQNQPSRAKFTLHAYASIEGNKKENQNLSCYRARRVERDLLNAGVLPENIEVKWKGPTSKFDVKPQNHFSEENLRANRRIVIKADTTGIPAAPKPPVPEPAPANLTPAERVKRLVEFRRKMLATAKATLTGGHYRLAADAYLSRWTCGEFPTLAQAVARLEVRLTGEPAAGGKADLALTAGDRNQGVATENATEVLNIIVLPFDRTFASPDPAPLNCMIARIIDLTFHLDVLPHLANFNKRHAGGQFLVELAGFLPCTDPDGTNWFPGEVRPSVDPLENEPLPPCAREQLEGAFVSEKKLKEKGRDLGGKEPLNFTAATPLTVSSGSTPTDFTFDLATNRASLGSPANPVIAAGASIAAKGDPTLFPNYELGFIRSLDQDETLVEYVDGFNLRRSIPDAIRDGAAGDRPPWLGAAQQPGPADAPAKLSNSSSPSPPKLEFPFAILLNPFITFKQGPALKGGGTGPAPAVNQPGRLPIDPLAENILRRVQRRLHYIVWTAVRRTGAPLDRLNTRFLEAQQVSVLEKVDLRIASDGQLAPKVTTKVTAQEGGPGLEQFAHLDGPTPDAFPGSGAGFLLGDKRVLTRELPVDRDQSDEGEDESGYSERMIDICTPIRQQLGLTQALSMRVRIDPQTGRMLIPGISSRGTGLEAPPPFTFLPVEVVLTAQNNKSPGTFASPAALAKLSELAYLRARRFLVLRRRATGPNPDTFSIQVDLPALPGAPAASKHMHEFPGALALFRQLWQEFSADCILERRYSIILDRRTGTLRKVGQKGNPAQVKNGQIVHSVSLCLQQSKIDDDSKLGLHETVLGAVHTHPKGIAPSLEDNGIVAQMEGVEDPAGKIIVDADRFGFVQFCGRELYTLLRDANGDLVVIRMHAQTGTDDQLGPLLGNVPECK